jgi:threonylcarbamoyladenosine tRNA methylthiotransferase CDKAL1
MRMTGRMKAYVEAYGCALNFGESREIEDLLADNGWEIVREPEDADLAILVTCVVIEATEREMLKRVKQLSRSKRLLVTGCMATACREEVERLAPNALLMPPGSPGMLAQIVDGIEPVPKGAGLSRDSFSIVPIATGCRGSCSYCITRLARGELTSRAAAGIIEAVRRAATDGPREIQLTAQDAAAYGADIGSDLPKLVSGICCLPLDFRLRVGMMNPKSAKPLVEGLMEMYLEPKVFKFLHLPVQSASDRLLEDMERGYSLADFKTIVEKVRECVPDITLSTDIIVGYPGETPADHRSNLRLISDLKPDIVNVTRFSPRPGTKASKAEDQVVGWKTKDRSREITKLRFEVAAAKNLHWVGTRARALSTERGKEKTTILRNDEYKQIVLPQVLPLGRFFDVEIVGATPTYLVGKKVAP